ncbi:hypothetical protein [Nocardia neocaledoniensis]|uniref:hypothetical protein n=1 Tax=Nocardia neocaledoniensis TaxID=236511 RepID=UPI0024547A85|nr:hypothetical protein [Nocardia neocaledoniensis]
MLDPVGAPISGLYAAASSMATVSGPSSRRQQRHGAAMVFARRAALHMAERVPAKKS